MKVAITGTIGSGKTTACDYIRSKGFYVFDCDKYNSYLLEEGNLGYILVKDAFPEAFENEKLQKSVLSSIIFSDKVKKEKLESLLHPLICEQMLKEANNYKPFFAEVPLLFETGMDKLFDESLLLVVDRDIAIERLKDRGFSKEQATERINNQMNVENKMKRATEIIYNNGNLSNLLVSIDKWLKRYVG